MRLTKTTLSLAVLLAALPGLAAADWEAGVAAFKAGKYGEAATQFQQVIEQQPDLFQGYFMLGQTLLKDEQPAKAVPHLKKALELNAGNAQIQLLLGQALYKARKYREVVQVLGSLDAEALPKGAQAGFYQMRGGSYQQVGQTERAVADLRKVTQLKPSDADGQFAYGTAALSIGQLDNALGALEQAVRLDTRDPAKKKTYVQALVRKGRLTKGSEKEAAYNKAVAAAQALVSSQSTYDNLLLLGEVQLGSKSYDAAIESFSKARAKKASDWLPNFYIGQAYTAKGQFSSADEPLRTALQLASSADDERKVWRQLGFVHEKQKNYEESMAAYEKAGDRAGYQRVAENKAIFEENRKVEEHNKMVEQLEEEAKALEEELKSLPGGTAPPRR